MQEVNITIETTNAAFDDDNYELARIFDDLSKRCEQSELDDCTLFDINGNAVGRVTVKL